MGHVCITAKFKQCLGVVAGIKWQSVGEFLFLFLFGGIFAILSPSHEGRAVYVTQAAQVL
jgi:hypothetical protein